MDRKVIAVLTATRAEYGLLKPVIQRIHEDPELELALLVTGTHLLAEFGNTCQEILDDGVPIRVKIPIVDNKDSVSSVSKTMANALEKFGVYFEKYQIDMLIVLGDRYETIAVCLAAMNARIPIAHIHGGEITEGAIDDVIRHAITKLSYLHFPATKEYAERIIQLGEAPERVFMVGALGVENIKSVSLLSRDELGTAIGFSLEEPYAVVTFHPTTLDGEDAGSQFQELLNALDGFAMRYIITKANADRGGHMINEMVDQFALTHDNVCAVASLGMLRYLSAVKYAAMVIGNSSSGIIEVPSFQVPTVDIGDRQRGRIAASSVIHCGITGQEIRKAMEDALGMKSLLAEKAVVNPYEADGTSEKIISICKEFVINNRIDLKKKFYDLHIG